jgi:hypothetical protein
LYLALAFVVALVSSTGSLLGRYEKRRPFNSKHCWGWSLGIIVVVALTATAAGQLGLQVIKGLPPGLGTFGPPLLLPPAFFFGRRLGDTPPEPNREQTSPTLKLLSLGVIPMMTQLEQIMRNERSYWIRGNEERPCGTSSIDTIETQASDLYHDMRVHFRDDSKQLAPAKVHYLDIQDFVEKSSKIRGNDQQSQKKRRRLRNDACTSYQMLRGEAYDLKFDRAHLPARHRARRGLPVRWRS